MIIDIGLGLVGIGYLWMTRVIWKQSISLDGKSTFFFFFSKSFLFKVEVIWMNEWMNEWMNKWMNE
jgi:hypothetical protein